MNALLKIASCASVNKAIWARDVKMKKSGLKSPLSIFIHFLTIEWNSPSVRNSVLKNIPLDQDFVLVKQTSQYHLIFIQIVEQYYLAFVQAKFLPRSPLTFPLTHSQRCPQIAELLNASVMASPLLRRIKYYHLPCRENQRSPCFYDDDRLCICTNERHANCLDFDHRMTYDCQGAVFCQNEARCFQDHPTCPSSLLCVCQECFFGSRCQFNSKGYSLSLDFILGYQIRPRLPFDQQTTSVKVSLAMIVVLFLLGLIISIFVTAIFTLKFSLEKLGTGVYLLASSITSKGNITHRSLLTVSCVTIDVFLETLLSWTG